MIIEEKKLVSHQKQELIKIGIHEVYGEVSNFDEM